MVVPLRAMWPKWMVCVEAAEGLAECLPSGWKAASAIWKDWEPERRMTAKPPSPIGVAIAAMVSELINVATVALSVFGIPALEEKPGFFVALLLEVMAKGGICAGWEDAGEVVDTLE